MKKFDYSTFTALELVLDDYFKQWVLHPDQESEAFWQEWIALHPDRKPVVDEARQMVLSIRFKEDQMSAQSFARIREHLDAVYDEEERKQMIQSQDEDRSVKLLTTRRWGNWYRAAAVFTGLLVCTVLVWMAVYRNRGTQIATGYGESQLVVLPDGSTVKLNANSCLSYQSDWENARVREVWLEGEAFFTVVKKNNHGKIPFVVHTGKLNVRVLGTEFNVNNRHEKTIVVLNSGSVKLETEAAAQHKDMLMVPGDLVQFSEKDVSFVKKTVNPEKFSSWTHNLLNFDNASLREVAQVLEDTYGLKVKFENEQLASRKFTATLPVNKPEVLLTAISESLNIRVTRKDNEVTLQHNL